MGTITRGKLTRICTSLGGPGRNTISKNDIQKMWGYVEGFYTMDPVNGREGRLNAMELLTTVEEALGAEPCIALANVEWNGLSAFYVVAKAIRDVATFPWHFIIPGLEQVPRTVSISMEKLFTETPLMEQITSFWKEESSQAIS